MLSHIRIWAVIDALAARNGLTPSALARKAGLDATAFNRSKRVAADGRPRWPSTESLAKVLDATGTDAAAFAGLILGLPDGSGTAPRSGAAPEGFSEEVAAFHLPVAHDARVVPVSGALFEPLYREGSRLVVSEGEPIRPGDRILYTEHHGATGVAEVRVFGETVELERPGGEIRILARDQLAFVARILWVSQ